MKISKTKVPNFYNCAFCCKVNTEYFIEKDHKILGYYCESCLQELLILEIPKPRFVALVITTDAYCVKDTSRECGYYVNIFLVCNRQETIKLRNALSKLIRETEKESENA